MERITPPERRTIPIFLPDVPPFGTGQALDLLLREPDTERRLGEISGVDPNVDRSVDTPRA
jgi:hypothetical protein